VVICHGQRREPDAALDALEGVSVEWRDSEQSLMQVIARQLPSRLPFNLLTGPYSRREQLGRLWRPWRAAAAVLVAWALVQTALVGVEVNRLERERTELDAQMREIYERTLPGSRASGDPRRQMESVLAARAGGEAGTGVGDLGDTLGHAAPLLAQVPGLRIQSLRYRPGQVDMDLELDSLQSLDQVKQRLETDAAWSVEIQSASARDDRVESRILIRRAGS
jgi:general secretion pathway protein L